MYERRLRLLVVAYVLILCVIGARAFALQVVEVGDHVGQLETRCRRTLSVLPRRGEILYANGTPMAANVPGFGLEVAFRELDDRVLPEPEQLARSLGEWTAQRTELDAAEVAATTTARDRAVLERRLAARRAAGDTRRNELLSTYPEAYERYVRDGLAVRRACAVCGHTVRSIDPPTRSCRECGTPGRFEVLPPFDVQELADLLDEERATVDASLARALLRRARRPAYRLHALMVRIEPHAAEEIALKPWRFAGLDAVPRAARIRDDLAAQLVGRTRLPTAADMERLTDPAREADGLHIYSEAEVYPALVGAWGLEAQFDDHLRGVPGRSVRVREHDGVEPYRTEIRREVMDGAPLQTSIVPRLQRAAEEIVARAPAHGAGAAIVMDVRTGAILAMASASSDGLNHAHVHVQPGSVFKLITALAILETGLDPEEEVVCNKSGVMRGRGKYVCMHAHGPIALVEAFERSCNGYFAQQAARLGAEPLAASFRSFGLERRFDLGLGDMHLGEAGLARSGPEDWERWDLMMIGIGQGRATSTPLQIVTAYARLAAGGTAVTPWLVEPLRPDPTAVRRDPALVRHAPLLQAAARAVVVSGTGQAQVELGNADAAGKSGTAEVLRRDGVDPPSYGQAKYVNNTWFVGYAPHDAPRFAAVVVFERMKPGAHGATEAGDPVGRLLIEALSER